MMHFVQMVLSHSQCCSRDEFNFAPIGIATIKLPLQ